MAWIPVRPLLHDVVNQDDTNDRLPLITISIVRTISFTMYTSTKRILNSSPTTPTSSRKGKEREVEAPWVDLKLGMFNGNSAKDVAITSLLAGGASGAVVCVGSAPFELVKVGPPYSLSFFSPSPPLKSSL
jgi:solute carrier family 25 carnitine/acylcarnitine transporter 20/29